jgi:hypothetical protein
MYPVVSHFEANFRDFGLFKIHESPWGLQTNILYFVCIISVVPCQLRLKLSKLGPTIKPKKVKNP